MLQLPFSGIDRTANSVGSQEVIVCASFVKLPHVFLEIKVPAEPFSAHPAGEGFLVVVSVHVEGQVVYLMKRFGAY